MPASGDTLSVGKTLFPESNNGNATAFAALRDEKLVGGSAGRQTITDAYADAMAGVGVRVQRAQAASTMSQEVARAAADEKASKTGVNLDEEAANLIQAQQSYQAAAKVLQVAQQVFDTLLQTAAG